MVNHDIMKYLSIAGWIFTFHTKLNLKRCKGLYVLFIAWVATATTACNYPGSLRTQADYIKGFPEIHAPSPVEVEALAQANAERLSRDYQAEHQYRGGLPQRCLALSGGGLRSALFSIGVMGALSKRQELDSLDIISAVSGGGYALGWYINGLYDQAENLGQLDKDHVSSFLFEMEGLHALLKNIEKVYGFGQRVNDVFILGVGTYFSTIDILTMGFLEPLRWGQRIFGSDPPYILSRYSHAYRNRLSRAFLADTPPFLSLGLIDNALPTPSLLQLAQTMKILNLPIFIFNATIQSNNIDSVPVPNKIFEYTPFHQGSDGSGYIAFDENYRPPYIDKTIQLSAVMATSSAALDLPIENAVLAYLRDRSFFFLGQRVPARSFDPEAGAFQYFHLSDAGHTDNLAAFSLLRRGCKHVVIVDAEDDEDYVFDGYRHLQALGTDYLGARLHVPTIDEYLKMHPPGDPRSERQVWHYPWMEGTVEGLPVRYTKEIDRSPIRITYLKLSFDPTIFSALTDWQRGKNSMKQISDRLHMDNILMSLSDLKQFWENDDDFPYYPTIDQHGIPPKGQRALILLGMLYMEGALEQFNP